MSRSSGSLVRRAGILAMLCSLICASSAESQVRPPPRQPAGPTPRSGSWEVGGGAVFVRGYDFGDAAAELTRNGLTGTDGFSLFVTDSRVGSTAALRGYLAYYLSPRLAVEGGIRYARPKYSVDLSADVEGAPAVTAEETLNQYVFTGSALWHFGRPPSARARVAPFVFGGAGYIRELHEGQELVETGTEYHIGGGIKYWFGDARRRFGLRGDGGLSFRDGGFDSEDKVRMVPFAGASLVYLF